MIDLIWRRLTAKGIGKMKTYSIGLYEKAMPETLSWEEKMICARECGFDYIEISIDETDARLGRLDWTPEEREKLLHLMYQTKLPIRSMCLSGHRRFPLGAKDASVRMKSLEIMEKAIGLAADLGLRTIQLAGYDYYYSQDACGESRQYFLQNLKTAVDMAAAAGIVMGFETMEVPFMNTVWKSMFYINAIQSAWLGVYPDTGNMTNAALGGDNPPVWDLAAGAGHLFAMHLKAAKPGVFRNMLLDAPDSCVDFKALIGQAWELGVRRYVTEMWYLNTPGWKTNICRANEEMRAILDGCEVSH